MNTPSDPKTRLDEILAALARQPLPKSAPNFGADVWREIKRRRVEPEDDWVITLFNSLRRPTLAIPAFAFAIVVGTFVGAVGATKSNIDIPLARQSLYLEVFEPNASGLPAALVNRR